MRKLFLILLSGALFTACIDKDYDLGEIDTDNIAIGDESSRFEIPLARVLVTLEEITSGNGTDIDEVFGEADTWLPTQLPGRDDNGYYADIPRLLDNLGGYTDGLLDALVTQMLTDDAKINDVAELLCEDKYFDTFREMLRLPANTKPEAFIPIFIETFRTQETLRDELSAEVKNVAGTYLTGIEADVQELSYEIGRIDISDDVVKMLTDNLDPKGTPDAKNTLHLAGNIDNKLPVALNIAPDFTGTEVSFSVEINANRQENKLPDTRLYAEDMQQIVRGVTIKIPVDLKKYYPGKGFDKSTGADGKAKPQIEIKLHLIKNGGLKLDI